MLLKFKLFFLRPYFFLRKHLLKNRIYRYPQRKKYNEILNTLKNKPISDFDSLFLEISGKVIKRDYKEIPKAGKYAILKTHPIYDSREYLKTSYDYLIEKKYIKFQNNIISLTPEGNMFLEDKRGFVEELIVANFDEALNRWLRTLGLATAIISVFFAVKKISDFF